MLMFLSFLKKNEKTVVENSRWNNAFLVLLETEWQYLCGDIFLLSLYTMYYSKSRKNLILMRLILRKVKFSFFSARAYLFKFRPGKCDVCSEVNIFLSVGVFLNCRKYSSWSIFLRSSVEFFKFLLKFSKENSIFHWSSALKNQWITSQKWAQKFVFFRSISILSHKKFRPRV